MPRLFTFQNLFKHYYIIYEYFFYIMIVNIATCTENNRVHLQS